MDSGIYLKNYVTPISNREADSEALFLGIVYSAYTYLIPFSLMKILIISLNQAFSDLLKLGTCLFTIYSVSLTCFLLLTRYIKIHI